jgi:hypothetical protein
MNLSKQLQINILINNNLPTIASLEFLLMLHGKVQQRSKEELLEYSEILNSRELFLQAKLKDLPGLCHFVGEGKNIKQVVIDWMIKYTIDEATALHVCAFARSVSKTLYDSILLYKKEAKIVTSGEWFFTYLWLLLNNTRYSVLHTMLIEANQLQHLEKDKEKKALGVNQKKLKNQYYLGPTHITTL